MTDEVAGEQVKDVFPGWVKKCMWDFGEKSRNFSLQIVHQLGSAEMYVGVLCFPLY